MGRHSAAAEIEAPTVRITARPTVLEHGAASPRWARRLWVGVAAASVLGIGLATVHSASDDPEQLSRASGASQATIDYSDPAVSAYLSRLGDYATPDTDGLVLAGYQSCQWWSEGYTTTQVLEGVTEHYGPRLGLPADAWVSSGAPPITTAAMVELCPEVGALPAARY